MDTQLDNDIYTQSISIIVDLFEESKYFRGTANIFADKLYDLWHEPQYFNVLRESHSFIYETLEKCDDNVYLMLTNRTNDVLFHKYRMQIIKNFSDIQNAILTFYLSEDEQDEFVIPIPTCQLVISKSQKPE